ncbi:MAG: glyoxylate/hydroxypyruvate reductase A [Pseudomonadota bacterium]
MSDRLEDTGRRGAVVLHVGASRALWWRDHMGTLLPEYDVHLWDEVPDPAQVRFAVVWKHPAGGLQRFPGLQAIVSIGAGVDHVFVDPDLPMGVPVLRTTGPDLTQRMREYICLNVLRLHRRDWEVRAASAAREWRQNVQPPATARRVGVMGLGNLGADAAIALAALGFDTAGWTRRPRDCPGIAVYAGDAARAAFLARSDILVCLLPLTPATDGILNADLFAQLPHGAGLINAARGGHLVEEDLIPALDQGHLCRAVLDVFRTEPLPPEHPFWADARIDITPHTASMIDPEAGGRLIAENIRRFAAGAPVDDLVDPTQGY